MNRIIITLVIIADLDESTSGESRRLMKPIHADRKSKFDDLM
ncbi:hypothetical protein OIU83_05230 [Flavobacterium sp. LS1R49]|uniref:Uncharacterized protein n=1 Tax=Flavobacterium shii TaxID=2987687 RepID=A0A9X3BXC1_9FLAO|nr:hypothetical protein [Flavobacterium shii]MCV9927040.1 hypothetical protein [Flavobacterium shii]